VSNLPLLSTHQSFFAPALQRLSQMPVTQCMKKHTASSSFASGLLHRFVLQADSNHPSALITVWIEVTQQTVVWFIWKVCYLNLLSVHQKIFLPRCV